MTMKVCSKCKETKFFDMFRRNKNEKDGYHNQCKACLKAYYEANKEMFAEQSKAYRVANKERYAESKKAYRAANKEKVARQKKAYYEANKEKLAEYNKANYEVNKEKLALQRKAYKENNKDKTAEYNKAYKEANKDKTAEYNSRRRARKRNAIPKFLRNCGVEKQRLRGIYKLRQLISEATGIEHHVDHMWPLSKGGPHWSGNLQIITATKNLSKNDKLCKTLKKNIKASLEIARKEYVNDEDNSNRH